jgi:capsular polysaccharide biosynthesis protein
MQIKMALLINDISNLNSWVRKGLHILTKKMTTCTYFLVGKQHKVAFKRPPSHVLDLIHTDI